MKKLTVASVALLILSACGKQDPVPPPPQSNPPSTTGRPQKMPNGESALITVKHVLIQFEGAERSQQKRTKAEAQKLAYEILGRAKSGEDFDKLMKESNDPGEGTYTLVNEGIQADRTAGEIDRHDFAPAFCDVAFRILVDEVGIAEYDPQNGRFGWHVIKRVK